VHNAGRRKAAFQKNKLHNCSRRVHVHPDQRPIDSVHPFQGAQVVSPLGGIDTIGPDQLVDAIDAINIFDHADPDRIATTL
jgi:hypothetical protein